MACSQILRDCLLRYDSFVPTATSSSLCYFILQSNRLFIGNKSLITQIDPLFNYGDKELRAIEHLTDPNNEIKELSREIHSSTFENLKRILKSKPHVFEDVVSKESQARYNYLEKMVKIWMKKEEHDKPLSIKELKELKVNFKIVEEEVISKTKIIIAECLNELIKEDKRFVIQTSKIEENKYFGGYFYD
jgi:hypothetical protein